MQIRWIGDADLCNPLGEIYLIVGDEAVSRGADRGCEMHGIGRFEPVRRPKRGGEFGRRPIHLRMYGDG